MATSTDPPAPGAEPEDGEPGEAEVVSLAAAVDLPKAEGMLLLQQGEITVVGRLVAASNATLLVTVSGDLPGRGPVTAAAIHKPVLGERPLWDFPEGTLAAREVAAHAVSDASGWDIVPPTVLRADGPFGQGMLQLWVETSDDVDPASLLGTRDPRLRRIAVFDAVVNNADRKAGHLLVRPDGRVQGVDHGVTFHAEAKLRTVLWEWRGMRLARAELAMLRALAARLGPREDLGRRLGQLLAPAEVAATRERVGELLRSGRFPEPAPDWPAIPWPWY
ncbi:MAG: SCO1664 family protein [Chloroflexi bacterium]|jgi:hypothetical protein|nr:SCO1664 family protein [Chloroflexota bacterium]